MASSSTSGSERFANNLKDPVWWRNQAVSRFVVPFLEMNNRGIYVLDETWDSLIILDACRYDIFEEATKQGPLRGTLHSRISRATDTTEFLLRNFAGRRSDDVVYVSANPFADKFIKKDVHKLVSVWRTHWDEEEDTVLPQSMYECTRAAAEENPGKRIVAHFIQPHYPYIGHKALNVSKFLSAKAKDQQRSGRSYRDKSIFTMSSKLIYAMAIDDRSAYLTAYRDNLLAALPYVEKLTRLLPGKTVVTADHGEAFGERLAWFLPIRVYGHMPRMRISSLTKVPWFVTEAEEKAS